MLQANLKMPLNNLTLEFVLDAPQQALIEIFHKYTEKLNSNFIKGLLNFFKKGEKKLGLYIYGEVGRGKTILTKKFFESLTLEKEFFHFQIFMKSIHERSHILRQDKAKAGNFIEIIAEEYSRLFKIIFIDEFEVKDIADAMMLARLIPALQANRVFIIITTNTKPSDLYKNGIQRQSFLPFIEYIENNFEIFCLNGNIDYRLSKKIFDQKILYPISSDTQQMMDKYIEQLMLKNYQPHSLSVYGRLITFKNTHKKILLSNFEEMFIEEKSQADYIEICKYYEIIIIEKIRLINNDERNIALRLINFLDQLYFAKCVLITQLEEKPENILSEKSNLTERARAISRIHEMNSEEYIKNSKYYKNLYE